METSVGSQLLRAHRAGSVWQTVCDWYVHLADSGFHPSQHAQVLVEPCELLQLPCFWLPDEGLAAHLRLISISEFNFTQYENNVLWVNQSDFDSCNVPSEPLGSFSQPNTVVDPWRQHGDTVYYFIDGIGDNCAKGYMRLRVQLQVGAFPRNFIHLALPCLPFACLITLL